MQLVCRVTNITSSKLDLLTPTHKMLHKDVRSLRQTITSVCCVLVCMVLVDSRFYINFKTLKSYHHKEIIGGQLPSGSAYIYFHTTCLMK